MAEGIKVKLFKLLTGSKDGYISGAYLANELSVSRASVWKAVETLRTEGYQISAVTNKGYRIESGSDIFSQTGIAQLIKTAGVFNVELRKTVTSTNTVLRELAGKGAPEGYVLVAEVQTAGKGRLGRSFYSPAEHGVYFSVLLRPDSKSIDAPLITSAAAVAASRAIEEVTGVHVGIKWVNDLFYKQKKVCGILTEATFGMESGIIDSIILGVGINVTRPENGFPGTLYEIADALVENTGDINKRRCRLIAATLDNFWGYYMNLADRHFLEEYRARSIVLGNDIFVVTSSEKKPAHAIAIDDDCKLIVRYEDGTEEALNSGEVSIRHIGI